MAGGGKMLLSLVASVLVGMRGAEGSYQIVPSQEDVFLRELQHVHPTEPREHEAVYRQQHLQPHDYQHLEAAHPQPYRPALSTEVQLFLHPQQQQQPQHEQYLVQSGYNVATHQGQRASQQESTHQKQRQTALPCNHERLHVKIEYSGAAHGIAHPDRTLQHLHQQLGPKEDYNAAIPQSIAPKLNPLHPSFHQNRNFVPLHHITRQVPVPAERHGGHIHSHELHHPSQQQPVKAALAAPPPKHIAG